MRPGRAALASGSSKKAPAVTGLTAVNQSTAGYTTVAWTPPHNSLHTGILVERSIDGGGYTTVATLGVGASTTGDFPGYSLDATYRVTALRSSGVNSDPVVSSAVRTPPNVPSLTGISAANGGFVTMTGSSPGHGRIAGFDVALSTNDGSSYAATVDSGADPNHTFSGVGHLLTCRVRSRTRDTFGQVSAWANWPNNVVSLNDVTAPVSPAVTAIYSGGNWLVSWAAPTDSQSAVVQMSLQMNYDGAGWYTHETFYFNTGAISNHIVFIDLTNRGKTCQFRMACIDAYGNGSVSADSVAYQSKPYGIYTLYAQSSSSWGDVGWRSDNDDVYSGNAGSPHNTMTGFWFYNGQIATACKGFAPDAGSIYMQRNGSSGVSGDVPVATHGHAFPPGSPGGLGAAGAGPTLVGSNAAAEYSLPGGMLAEMGTGVCAGIATTPPASGFRRLFGCSSQPLLSGRLTLTFNA